ncbi:amino acid ABC transporter permease [Halocynthiibacter namhaensis]|uniref:amino acid ABC transporter permease n=1 Tax=Halocynthiibacter namhaensis TaxID=1290553 RepID=UPI001EE1C2FD|nr:ABC transporter permease subunit [Halocynthiibacter namhaensis]
MTVMTDPPKESFRLSMLIYDTRYRSITIQVVALLGFAAFFGWLIWNTSNNLAALGKEPSFRFLWEPAGYDINQRLLDYNSQSPHIRAAVIGVLNTLVIAVLGCITATIIGVLVGVLRLSKNWVISRLMGVYVETFRNVPVLLWIVLAMAIMIEIPPAPKEFRGDNATASVSLFGTVAVTNRGVYVPDPNFGSDRIGEDGTRLDEPTGWRVGLGDVDVNSSGMATYSFLGFEITPTLQFWAVIVSALIASVIVKIFGGDIARSLNGGQETTSPFRVTPGRLMLAVLLIAIIVLWSLMGMGISREVDGVSGGVFQISLDFLLVVAVLLVSLNISKRIKNRADDIQEKSGVRPTVWYIRLAVVVLPMAILLWALGLYFTYPELKGFNFKNGLHLRNSLIALWLALSLYTAAFIAEIVRSGIMAISKGQSEAANALGLSSGRTMRLIVLPQALRVIIPPMISNYLNLTKNSSLAIAVGYFDITGTLMGVTLNQTGRELETVLLGMLIYLTISLSISMAMNWYNESVKLKER